MFKVIVRDKAHAGFNSIADNESRTSRVEAGHSLRLQSLLDDRKWCLSLSAAQSVYQHSSHHDCTQHTLPPNWERVLTNSVGYVTKL
jgi:hypothetical protein